MSKLLCFIFFFIFTENTAPLQSMNYLSSWFTTSNPNVNAAASGPIFNSNNTNNNNNDSYYCDNSLGSDYRTVSAPQLTIFQQKFVIGGTAQNVPPGGNHSSFINPITMEPFDGSKLLIFGLFDGDRNNSVCEYLQKNFIRTVKQKCAEQNCIQQEKPLNIAQKLKYAVQGAIDDIHDSFLKRDIEAGSSVLAVFFYSDQKLGFTIVHAGNSLGVMKRSRDQAILLTNPHVARNAEELLRITNKNLYVINKFFYRAEASQKPYLTTYNPFNVSFYTPHKEFCRIRGYHLIEEYETPYQPHDHLNWYRNNQDYSYETNEEICNDLLLDDFIDKVAKNEKTPPPIRPMRHDLHLLSHDKKSFMRTTRGVGFSQFSPHFSCELAIRSIRYTQGDCFIILGTAGFWDIISPTAACQMVEEEIQDWSRNNRLEELCPKRIANKLVCQAQDLINFKNPYNINFVQDQNITVTVILFLKNIHTIYDCF